MLYSIGRYSRALFSIATLLFFASVIQAQTRTAINNGIWNDIANWDCSCIPSDTEDVVIGDALTINVSGTVTINSVTVNNLAVFTVNDTLYITGSTTISGGFNNSGIVYVGADLTNNGAVSGPGTYCIQGVTTNTQSMLGPMDFCDLTPPPSAPFVDNPGTGFIQPNVLFCQNGICIPSNTSPVNALDSILQTVMEDTPMEICVTSTDTDGDALDVTAVINGPSNGTVSGIGDGDTCFTYSPSSSFLGNDTFSAVVCDGNGGCDTTLIVITVVPNISGTANLNSKDFEVNVLHKPGFIQIELERVTEKNLVFELLDLQGRLVLKKEVKGNNYSLKLAEELHGVYLYRLTSPNEILDQGKLLFN